VKAENEKDRGTVAAVSEPGYTADGKVIHKAKVHVYN
jgi:molecular chaperone GrpE (heat shock protein)